MYCDNRPGLIVTNTSMFVNRFGDGRTVKEELGWDCHTHVLCSRTCLPCWNGILSQELATRRIGHCCSMRTVSLLLVVCLNTFVHRSTCIYKEVLNDAYGQ